TFSLANANAIVVSDADDGGAAEQVTIDVVSGTLALSTTTGLTFTSGANGTSAMVFTGTIAAIDQALAGAVFTPDANFSGAASVSVSVDDLGNSGAGGAQTTSASTTINVGAVNDAPVVDVPSGSATTAIDTPITLSSANGDAITIVDVDAGGA